jgi:hypothetical protein
MLNQNLNMLPDLKKVGKKISILKEGMDCVRFTYVS